MGKEIAEERWAKLWDSTRSGVWKAVAVAVFVLLLYIAGVSCFAPSDIAFEAKPVSVLVNIAGTALLLIAAVWFCRNVINKLSKQSGIVLGIAAVLVMGLLQLTVAVCIVNRPTGDLNHVIGEVENMLEDGFYLHNEEYFGRYPNNYPTLFIVYGIYWLGTLLGFSSPGLFANLVNIVLVDITVGFVLLSVKRLWGNRRALAVLLLIVCNPQIYYYLPYYYSDTFSLPFMGAMLYLAALLFTERREPEQQRVFCWRRMVLSLLLGLAAGIGVLIRATVIIPAIAIVVYLLFAGKLRKNLPLIVLLVFGIAGTNAVYQEALSRFEDVEYLHENYEFPTQHWIMMGLNTQTHGAFSLEDFQYTKSFATYEEKKAADIAVTKERLADLGPVGLVNHLVQKTGITWGNGRHTYYAKVITAEEYGLVYDYLVGDRSMPFTYYCQMYHGMLMLLCCLAVWSRLRAGSRNMADFSMITIFGAIVFYWIWEANGRYSHCFFPYIMLLAGSFEQVKGLEWKETRKVSKWGIPMLTLLMTVCLLVGMFVDMCGAQVPIKSYVAKQNMVASWKIPYRITGDGELVQTFTASRAFNTVELHVTKQESSQSLPYCIEIVNHEGVVVGSGMLSPEDIEEVRTPQWISIDVGTVLPQHRNEEYQLRIRCLSSEVTTVETEDAGQTEASIVFTGHDISSYNPYPLGTLYRNGAKEEAVLGFRVFYLENDFILSPVWYLGFCTIAAVTVTVTATVTVVAGAGAFVKKHSVHRR